MCVGLGLAIQGPLPTLQGLVAIQVHPARLLNDFTLVGGDGAALVNAAVFTMFGFGLFGKTPLNVLPIMIGVGVAARIADKSYQEYILMALFGTALGPLITALAVEAGLPTAVALPVAVAGGLFVGIWLPAVAIAMLRLHQGFNLYNIGLTCGFIGVFAASILVASGRPLAAGVCRPTS